MLTCDMFAVANFLVITLHFLNTLGLFGVEHKCCPLAAKRHFRWYSSFKRTVFWHTY